MRTILTLFLSSLLGACMAPLMPLVSQSPAKVDAATVQVIDLTKPTPNGQDGYAPGFFRIGDTQFTRSPGAALKADIERSVRPSGTGAPMDIWLIDAGVYWEKTGVDLIPFVGIFTQQRSGRLKCDATISVRQGSRTQKLTIEQFEPIDTSDVKNGESIWKTAVSLCYPALLDKVVKALQPG